MTYSIYDGSFCYSKGYLTIQEAMTDGERFINQTSFGDLEDVTIHEGDSYAGKIVRTFHASIDWE
jgi:hypothetical protein